MQIAILSKNADLIRAIDNLAFTQQYRVRSFGDELSMIRGLRGETFALIVIDAALRYSRSHIVYQWRQSHGYHVPLLVVGTFRDPVDMQLALEADAADIVVGPINGGELSTRVRRAMRPTVSGRTAEIKQVGRYTLDMGACRIYLDDEPVTLTAREFQLGALLLANPGVNFSREQLSRVIWSNTREVAERSLEQYIYRLRKKMRLSPQTGVELRTLYAQGYRLEVTIAPGALHTSVVQQQHTPSLGGDAAVNVY